MYLSRILLLVAALAAAVPAARAATDGPNGVAAQFEDAVARFNHHDFRGAVVQLRNVLQADPKNLPARILMGRALVEQGLGVAAERHLSLARRDGADPDRVLVPLGRAYLQQGKTDAVLAELTPGQRLPQLEAQILNLRGEAYLDRREFEAALQEFYGAQALAPDNPDTTIGLVKVAVAERRLRDARRLAMQAVQRTPDSPELWFTLGELLRQLGERDGAIKAFSKAIDLAPDYYEARINRAASLFDAGQTNLARQELNGLREIGRHDPRIDYLQALIDRRAGEAAKADQSLNAAADQLAAMPQDAILNDPELLLIAGMVAVAQGRNEEAVQLLSQYTRSVPENAAARHALGTVYLRTGKTEQALAILAPLARSLRNPSPQLLATLGTAYLRMRRYDDAMDIYERAARAAPNNPVFRKQLGISRIAAGQRDAGLADLDVALGLGDMNRELGPILPLLYLQAGELDKALDAAKRYDALSPDNPVAVNLLGVIRLAQGAPQEARTFFERAGKLDPDFVIARKNLAALDLREGRLDDAKKRFESMLDNKRLRRGALEGLVEIARTQNNIDEAMRLLGELRKLDLKAVGPQLALARLMLQQSKPQDALNILRALEVNHPDYLPLLAAIAEAHVALGEHRKAVEVLRNAAQHAKTARQRLGIAKRQLALGDPGDARETLKAAVAADASYLPAQVMLTELDLASGRGEEALQRANGVKAAFPDSPDGERLLGDIYVKGGRYTQAAAAYRRALDKSPATLIAVRLANAEIRGGRTEAGLKVLRDWVSTHPDDPVAIRALASSYAGEGRVPQAITLYEGLVKKAPRDAGTLNNLAWLYHVSGDPRALEMAERAVRLAPNHATTLDTLGWILLERGEAARALPILREARARRGSDGAIAYHLASALDATGRGDEAVELLRSALAGPDFDGADKARELLDKLNGKTKPNRQTRR